LTDAEAQYYLGNLLLHSGRVDEAENYFKQALTLDGAFTRSHEGLGFVAMRRDNYAEAKEQFNQASAHDSKNYLAHYYYAESLYHESTKGTEDPSGLKPEIAATIITELKTSIKLMPRFAYPYYLLGYIDMALDKDLAEGAKSLQIAVKIEPQNKSFLLA